MLVFIFWKNIDEKHLLPFHKASIKNCAGYCFDDTIKILILRFLRFQNFEFDNLLIKEKSYKNILAYDMSYKISFYSKTLYIDFLK